MGGFHIHTSRSFYVIFYSYFFQGWKWKWRLLQFCIFLFIIDIYCKKLFIKQWKIKVKPLGLSVQIEPLDLSDSFMWSYWLQFMTSHLLSGPCYNNMTLIFYIRGWSIPFRMYHAILTRNINQVQYQLRPSFLDSCICNNADTSSIYRLGLFCSEIAKIWAAYLEYQTCLHLIFSHCILRVTSFYFVFYTKP